MIKTASISETRQNLSPLLSWIKETHKDVIIQNRGEAEAVIIPIADYDLLREARERKRRQQAIAELKRLAATLDQKNHDLTETEAEVLADEMSRDAINSLAAQGKVTFQD